MKLDVLIPTFNRANLLVKTVDSLLRTLPPQELNVSLTVVDNDSRDNTRELVQKLPVRYIHEPRRGKCFALNTGIALTDGDLVAMLDDDEEVSDSWYARIDEAFRDPFLDFIGGPYLPNFEAPPPKWLIGKLRVAVGWADFGNQPRVYDSDFAGMPLGGNIVIRREMLRKVGPYDTSIGRTGTSRLMGAEDVDYFERLLNAGARGMYFPDLSVHHWIPSARLRKSYLRKWTFWVGVSDGVREFFRPSSVPRMLGIPRYRYGKLATAVFGAMREPRNVFNHELSLWAFAGFAVGRHSRKYRVVAEGK
jgi:glycosyltransferase involved in cell wall biosynthesis